MKLSRGTTPRSVSKNIAKLRSIGVKEDKAIAIAKEKKRKNEKKKDFVCGTCCTDGCRSDSRLQQQTRAVNCTPGTSKPINTPQP